MSEPSSAALITLLNVLLIALAMWLVGRARSKHQVHAPATTGHPDFERAFRAHQNTIESTVMFLPTLWIATSYGDARIAAWLGWAWLVGRVWYLFAYLSPGGKRGPGFMIGALANLGLLGIGLWGLVPPLVRIG
jgi:uncharacterized MAPEG superfamily protein